MYYALKASQNIIIGMRLRQVIMILLRAIDIGLHMFAELLVSI